MADCASATVYVWPWPEHLEEPDPEDSVAWAVFEETREPLRGALAAVDIDPDTLEMAGRPYNGECTVETAEDGTRRLRVHLYSVGWGINDDEVRGLIDAAQKCGLAWLAEDGGYDTWAPYREWWHPGMEEPAKVQEDVDGGTVLDWAEFDRLRKQATDESGTCDLVALADGVIAHFDSYSRALAWRPAAEVPS